LAKNAVICDLDVDAPNLHLLLSPKNHESHDFTAGHSAVINSELCSGCGDCAHRCVFDAVLEDDGIYRVDPVRCEGCKVCVAFCPEKAIGFPEKLCGHWHKAESRFGPMAHAKLLPGEENSGKLVALLRKQAREMALAKGCDMVLCDGAPGIGCPVISSLSGTDLALVVTEPTPSGIHDMERVLDLCRHFKVRAAGLINKWDLNPDFSHKAQKILEDRGCPVIGKIPFDPEVTRSMVMGRVITEKTGQSPAGRAVQSAWDNLAFFLKSGNQSEDLDTGT
jgi:MinD superfamily P-loop ATPase